MTAIQGGATAGGISSAHAPGAIAPNAINPNAPDPKLLRAAQEFEGQLMKELLRPMTAGDGLTGDADDTGSGSSLNEFASEALGQALSRQGGFGIAERIVQELSHSHSGNQLHSGKVTGNPRSDTVMRGSE